jgi:DNA-binding transcriptional MerR regulator
LATLVKHIRHAHVVEFDTGKFDNWCVYLKRHGQQRYAPRDVEYFTFIKEMADIYTPHKVYTDFVTVYEQTNKEILPQVLALITTLADTYTQHAEEMDIWLTVLYAGMIAEENKANMVLRKRIKRLGMHQVIHLNMPPEQAARFSFGKKYAELHPLMLSLGF